MSDNILEQLNGQESLTEMELYCIAKHTVELVKVVFHEEEDMRHVSCKTCKYADDCIEMYGCLGTFHHTINKLSQITGVNISLFKGFKI
ncbi:hypothetical protein Dtox_4204 [Desulfofarcimen acetoxidans DSM 771]|uniref:Uncharacterized protein n=1 Tax=Desulfofarcimen acetoxidans (strain ATCC 49208 / DSM 771 / KCTC 5769 / VKM B-1644 / 5575) TaxID=485916 RepID=C8VZC6_DESAS|nr:hypothetical protein [Desulfofarcimen acetoxidans]ACV64871.1 hypothetical protein Dtox_4204 [Desulfofarcimen acetoxidans DSM 771]